jgi:Zn-dependent metalloprotease
MNNLVFKAFLLSAVITVCLTDVQAQQQRSGMPYSGIVLPVKDGTVSSSLRGKAVSKSDAVQHLAAMLGLSSSHTFKQVTETTDKLGISHTGFQQYYLGVKVDGAKVLVHSKDGLVTTINGNVAQLGTLSVQPVLKENEAYNKAKNSTLVTRLFKTYPVELVIATIPSADNKEYALAYKMRIDGRTADRKTVMVNVFVDAVTGKVLNTVSLITHTDVNGTANTFYSGSRPFVVDSFAGGFRLRDGGRNIQTYNGRDVPEDSLGFANWNVDYLNNTSNWHLFPILSATTLQTASPDLVASIGGNNLQFMGFNLSETAPETAHTSNTRLAYISGQPSLPILMGGYPNILDPAKSYFGTYLNIAYDTVLSTDSILGSASYHLPSISTGSHSWADTHGNSGSYTISMEKNPALDAHWGMEKTHDFYSTVMSRNSYDNNGGVIRNYVNAGMVNNAAAYGEPYNLMVYGMGDGSFMGPVVGLDVMGHEFTHMVTQHNGNGGLDYQGESGALNESFSDIFGTCIEFYAKGADANWTIGEGVILPAPGFMRSMSNPKLAENPDTYGGQYWVNPADLQEDGGGVHYNSGVQNKWFYLLSQGGTGTNDKGDAYAVTGIGIAKAQQIAYRNLTTYILPQSKYIDAYTGSLEATKDLYGNDTTKQEYKSVKQAWYAVGIGAKPATAINEITVTNGDLRLYPNPATNRVTISSALNQTLNAQIVNVIGVPVMNITVSKGLNPVDISALAKGMYIIRYNTGVKGYVQKLSVL